MTITDPYWPRASDWVARGDASPALVLLGVPTSVGSISPSEAWETPTAMRDALRRFSTFDGEASVDLHGLPVADWGDWLVAHLPATEAIESIKASTASLPTGPVYAFLGGDNLITYPIVSALPHAPLARTGVLTLDAHHDVRAVDDGVSNGAPIRLLMDEGLPGAQVVQVGIHSFANSAYYRDWASSRGVRVAPMSMVDEHGIERVIREALDYLAGTCEVIHVDLDIDVLDRVYAPACPGARPGGMTPRQLASAARMVGAHPKVVSADFVEVDATRDIADVTVMTMANTFLAFASGVASR